MNTAQIIANMLMSRTSFGTAMLDGKCGNRDIDGEAGYPTAISIQDYRDFYERGDIAARVVDIEPMECWKEYPEVYETEEERETPFESDLDKVIAETNLYSYLAKVDRASGIGGFGVLFIGFDDGAAWDKPVPGFNIHGPDSAPGNAKVLYYRVFDEGSVSVASYETDTKNPRYGLPLYYTLSFTSHIPTNASGEAPPAVSRKVHWSRVIHVADNTLTDELYGAPRMKNVFNRLMDIRKILAGSAEMFWKGGFPGLSFEVDPNAGEFSEEERRAFKKEVQNYANGLDRYLTTVGVSVKPLNIQISNPDSHLKAALQIIATTKGVPMRLLMGTEQGSLASTQDAQTWAERVAMRRDMYVTPHIIRPVVDRLIQVGAVRPPAPPEAPSTENTPEKTPKSVRRSKGIQGKDNYSVKWVPLAVLSETERAEVGKALTEALSRYATAGAEALIPLPEFLGKFLGFSYQQVEAIMKAPPSQRSMVFQIAGMSGQEGNVPSAIPKLPGAGQTKDPSKTPTNVVQPKTAKAPRKKAGSGTPQATK